eukprot:10129196-Lingulodinium_polyedra.AAC.1
MELAMQRSGTAMREALEAICQAPGADPAVLGKVIEALQLHQAVAASTATPPGTQLQPQEQAPEAPEPHPEVFHLSDAGMSFTGSSDGQEAPEESLGFDPYLSAAEGPGASSRASSPPRGPRQTTLHEAMGFRASRSPRPGTGIPIRKVPKRKGAADLCAGRPPSTPASGSEAGDVNARPPRRPAMATL